jgi:hypothetical protein
MARHGKVPWFDQNLLGYVKKRKKSLTKMTQKKYVRKYCNKAPEANRPLNHNWKATKCVLLHKEQTFWSKFLSNVNILRARLHRPSPWSKGPRPWITTPTNIR